MDLKDQEKRQRIRLIRARLTSLDLIFEFGNVEKHESEIRNSIIDLDQQFEELMDKLSEIDELYKELSE